MQGDVKIGPHKIRLTLGALEEISETDPEPAVIMGALAAGLYKASEVRAVIGAGLHVTGEEISVDELIDKHGMTAVQNAALEAMTAFFDGPPTPGKRKAAKKPAS